jgi:uncharacterized protein YjdB
MNRQLPGMLLTAFAFCITISCSDKSTTGPTGLALNDSTAAESRVVSATVTLAQSSLAVGQTTQATALLLDRYNNPLTLAVVWSSGDSSIATVSGAGLVSARAPGVVSIKATRGLKSGAATLTVTPSTVPAPVASISVDLPASSLTVGQTTHATATLRDSSNNVLSGRTVVWTSTNMSAATSSDSGTVTALAAGSTQIEASSGGKMGAAPLTVTSVAPVPVASVTVAPTSSNLVIGATVQLQVSAFDANNNPLTGRIVTSSSANPGIASINSLGLVTAISVGTTQITVTSEGKSAVATINVSLPPPTTNPSAVTNLQATVTGSSSVTLSFTQVDDGTGQPAKYDVRFAVAPISWGSAPSVTSGTCSTPVAGTAIGSQVSCTVLGLVAATNYNFQLVAFRGTMNLNAVYGSLSNTVAATTTSGAPPPVASVSVSPASSTLQIGATVQLQVTAFDANNNVLTGRVVTSSSANPAIATVNSLGLVTAVSAGVTQITVTSEGKTAIATITVSAAAPLPVATVSVSPASSSLQTGATVQLAATTRDASNNVLTGRVVTWSSSNSGIASVSSTGRVTAVAAGSATITATSETKTGTAAITVTAPAPVASVTVSPASSSLQVGVTVQLSATTRDASNNVLTGRVVTWSSSNSGIASVNASGLATVVAVGSATITATSETKTGTAAITGIVSTGATWRGHEPASMTAITDQPFTSLPSSGWTPYYSWGLTSDAAAPHSPSSVFEIVYPAGYAGGNSPGLAEFAVNPNYRQIYIAMYIKYSSNWQGHLTAVNKIIHFWVGSSNHLVIVGAGSGSGPLTARISLQGIAGGGNQDGGSTGTYESPIQFIRGQWHLVEMVAVSNTGSNKDGSADLWVDGVHATGVTGIEFQAGGPLFNLVKEDPTWGGGGDVVKNTQSFRVDHIYMSGKN